MIKKCLTITYEYDFKADTIHIKDNALKYEKHLFIKMIAIQ